MRELSPQQKNMVIKLFLEGYSYDEIANKFGVAKGSITNIIEELRTGNIILPADIAGYLDFLRKLAVDIKKNNTNVSELMSCLMIRNKLKSVGVSYDQLDSWIDICRQIASEDVTNGQFINAALELARLMSKTGMSYESVVGEFTKKSEELQSTKAEIDRCKEQVDELRHSLTEKRKHNIRRVRALDKELAMAVKNHDKSKEIMRMDLEKHMAENKMSWEKVDLAVSIFDKKLSEVGLTQTQIEEISKALTASGQLSVTISEQEAQSKMLSSELEDLSQKVDRSRKALQEINEQYAETKHAANSGRQQLEKVKNDYNWANAELEKAMKIVPQINASFTVAKLVFGFISDPKQLSAYDLDRFVMLMIAIRRKRLGRDPNKVKDANGKIICQCEVPVIWFDLNRDKYPEDLDGARQFLADLIFPLVKDRFVPKSEYETLQHIKNVEMMMDLVKRGIK